MPSFDSLARWVRYVPSLGNNQEQERPFYLEVAAGLTVEEYGATMAAIQKQGLDAKGLAAALSGVVRMGAEPLTVRGEPIDTLEKYLDLASRQLGADLLLELVATVTRYNSVEGAAELFSARLSGGSRTTRPAPGTADAPSGSGTKLSPGPTPGPTPLASLASVAGSSVTTAPSDPSSSDASSLNASSPSVPGSSASGSSNSNTQAPPSSPEA